jgi:hypothetical protein
MESKELKGRIQGDVTNFERFFQPRERARDSHKCLCTYHNNHRKVHGTEVEVAHPAPLRCGANEDRRESDYNDRDISRVDRHNDIGHHPPKHRILMITRTARIGETP